MLVVLDHANLARFAPNGADFRLVNALTAVQLFFVLSGFYMAATYRLHYREAWRSFLVSRVFRLWPTYLLSLVIAWALYLALESNFGGYPNGKQNRGHAFDYYVHVFSLPLWFHLSSISMLGQDLISVVAQLHLQLPNRVGWSIGAELAMYICVPFIFRISVRWLMAAVAVTFFVKFGLLHTLGFRWSYFPFFSNVGYFLLGFVLNWINIAEASTRLSRSICTSAGFALALVLCVAGDANFEANLWRHLIILMVLAVYLVTVQLKESVAPIRILGECSYALYLIHLPLLWFMMDRFGAEPIYRWAAVVLSVILALLIERCMRPLDRWRRTRLWST